MAVDEHPLLTRYHEAVDRAVDDISWAPNADFSNWDPDSGIEALNDVLEALDELGPMTPESATLLADILVPGGVAQTTPAALRPVMDAHRATSLVNTAMAGLRLLRADRLDVASHLDRLAEHPSTHGVSTDLNVVAAVLRSTARWDRRFRLPHHRHDASRLVRRVLDLLQRP